MMRRALVLIFCLLCLRPLAAQEDALNLPADLYVLLNDGVVQQYGLGAAGVRTVTPEGQFTIDFGIAPDGEWIATRTERAVTVSSLTSDAGAIIEANPGFPTTRGAGVTLVWSPNGGALAYTTETGATIYFRDSSTVEAPLLTTVSDAPYERLLWSSAGGHIAAGGADNLWWIYRRDGADMALVSVLPDAADLIWLDDNRFAFTPSTGGMTIMDVSIGNEQTPLLTPLWVYTRLARVDDNTLVAFARQIADPDDGTGLLTTIDLEAGSAAYVGQAPVDLSGLTWAPGGAVAVAFRGGALVLINPFTGQGFSLPINNAVAYDWGPTTPPLVEGLPLPVSLFFIAPDENGVDQVWQLPTSGGPPLLLTNSETPVDGYVVAPNGRSVAYTTLGSLWLQRFDGTEPLQLAIFSGEGRRGEPAFSRDSVRIAYADNGIWQADVNGTDPQLIAPGEPGERELYAPRYAPNVNALLVDVVYAEGFSTGLLDLTSGELQEMPFGHSNGQWLFDGRILTYGDAARRPAQAGLYVTPPTRISQPTELLPTLANVRFATETVPGTVRLVLAGGAAVGPRELRIADFREDTGLLPVSVGGFLGNPQISPDGGFIAGVNGSGGPVVLHNVASGDQVAVAAPQPARALRWARP